MRSIGRGGRVERALRLREHGTIGHHGFDDEVSDGADGASVFDVGVCDHPIGATQRDFRQHALKVCITINAVVMQQSDAEPTLDGLDLT